MIPLVAVVLLAHVAYAPGPTYAPDYHPANSLFGDCDPPYMPFKHKCANVALTTSGGSAHLVCDPSYRNMDLIESEDERIFIFKDLLGGSPANIFQRVKGNGTIFYQYGGDPTHPHAADLSYVISKMTVFAPDLSYLYNCTVTEGDMDCVPEADTSDVIPIGYAYCTYARPLYNKPMHKCDYPISHKLRKDATRTLMFPNLKADICYMPIKNNRLFKSSMVKIYGFSSSCPTGFLVSRNVNKEFRGDAIPQALQCGDGPGQGKVLMKKRSRRGEELRLYIVLNGDGTPMKIRAKGRAF